jgi:hypothetical protein
MHSQGIFMLSAYVSRTLLFARIGPMADIDYAEKEAYV